MRRLVVSMLRRFQRPIAWSMAGVSFVGAVAALSGIWKVDNKVEVVGIAVVLMQQGIAAVLEVETD